MLFYSHWENGYCTFNEKDKKKNWTKNAGGNF